MNLKIKIGTRESELAVWQATLIKTHLLKTGFDAELIYIKSEGDEDTVTPLYELGVQGIFTKTLDAALLSNKVDIAVHSMKDVPTLLALGIRQAAVLKRASYKDVLVYKDKSIITTWQLTDPIKDPLLSMGTIATSSTRRRAQWLHRYPAHSIENLRGNINTRLKKLEQSNWDGAIFAAAGLERINLRPPNAVDLDWMLPAPAQGAIMIVCRQDDSIAFKACESLNDEDTALCTKIERDFLRTLLGGCSTPISALAEVKNYSVSFKGNICSTDGKEIIEIEKICAVKESSLLGVYAAEEILKDKKAQNIMHSIRNEKK